MKHFNDIAKLSVWARQWLINFNQTKTKFIVFFKEIEENNNERVYLDGEMLGTGVILPTRQHVT